MFEDKSNSTNLTASKGTFSGDIQKVVKVFDGGSELKFTVGLDQKQKLDGQFKLDYSSVLRSDLKGKGILTIPIEMSKREVEKYVQVIYSRSKYLVILMDVTRISEEIRQFDIKGEDGHLLYSLQVNSKNQIGHFKVGNFQPQVRSRVAYSMMQLPETPVYSSYDESIDGGGSANCSNLPFNDCMKCLIIGHCGSDWVCVVACGLFPLPCVVGAGAACLIP